MSEIKYRKGVSALILNKDNELLLVNLESFDEKYYAVPGGGVEPEETLESAVYREIFEELGIESQSLSLVGQSAESLKVLFAEITLSRDGNEYGGQERYFFGFYFHGDVADIKPKADEVRSFTWVPMQDLKDYLLFENQLRDTVGKIREIFGDLN